ncbi:chemotaxis protein histidine kinase CheA [Pontibacter aydingkolensis]|uniref:DUF5606 domain-containing protein n=1 Tax=Pontibacter aydingkolensis TaxID=1911536 RepID=A0ABS7CZA2_9BACT|nr:DUF5606 domain-containing protein [Pontibacter aydingkolensis]MBW7469191.1 DUF5606 domain-containing protein [Pontibacter aydingkolensis]
MPIDLRQVAAISGQSGLYQIVKPTRTGVIVQSLEDTPRTIVAQARHRMSILDEISIYTTDEEGTVPLAEVFERIHKKYGDKLPLSEKPDNEDYKKFMSDVLPNYDEDRVYTSDMKKLAAWYLIVNKHIGFAEEEKETAAEKKAAKEQEAPKEKKAAADKKEKEAPKAKKATADKKEKTAEAKPKKPKADKE